MTTFAAGALQTALKLLGCPCKAAGEEGARGHDHLVTAGAAEDFKVIAVLVIVAQCLENNAAHVRDQSAWRTSRVKRFVLGPFLYI